MLRREAPGQPRTASGGAEVDREVVRPWVVVDSEVGERMLRSHVTQRVHLCVIRADREQYEPWLSHLSDDFVRAVARNAPHSDAVGLGTFDSGPRVRRRTAAEGGPMTERNWDEDASEIVRMVGRQVKLWRERAGLTQAELGAAIGYGEEQVSSVERGRRIPKPEFLNQADQALDADGILAALTADVATARYPKKVRDLARLEADAVELGAYAGTVVHGLFQTEEYARALFTMHLPVLGEDTIERNVAARMARQQLLARQPAPFLSVIQEEVALRRPLGGRGVLRRQLERLVEIGQSRHVELQVMPTASESHAALGGSLLLLESRDGSKVGYAEVQHFTRVITERNDLRILESRYGSLRAQALTPQDSLTFLKKLLGEI